MVCCLTAYNTLFSLQMPVSCPSYYSSLDLSSTNISYPLNVNCLIIRPSSIVHTVFFMINVVILFPTCTCICYLGIQQWCQQRSSSSVSMKSHTDIFTYHMTFMELFAVLGFILCCYEICCSINLVIVGYFIWTFSWFGETFFHLLICLERYVAVVHPLTYRSLRTEQGIKIRNLIIGGVWLFCFVGTILITDRSAFLKLTLCLIAFTLIAVSFCTLWVLCILIRPGPGEQSGNRGRMDQSKKKAFYTLITILGVVFLRCVWNIIWAGWNKAVVINECFLTMIGVWFNGPCMLVIPLLYLHKVGLFACC